MFHCRLPHSNYRNRMPRVPHYQTTPFTIDPSARSTQTFAERYGVSPPHSNENLYGNDYTIIGANDDKCDARSERPTKNHKVDLSKPSSSSNIIQQTNNNNPESQHTSKVSKSSVIKGSSIMPNNTHTSVFDDTEHQVSSLFRQGNCLLNCIALRNLRHVRHIIYVEWYFLEPFIARSIETDINFQGRSWVLVYVICCNNIWWWT